VPPRQEFHGGRKDARCYGKRCFDFASIRSVTEENRRLVAHISVSSFALIPLCDDLCQIAELGRRPILVPPCVQIKLSHFSPWQHDVKAVSRSMFAARS
jgi:hypothetical protein